jgi:type II secretory pathway predicted ATPase ExeA
MASPRTQFYHAAAEMDGAVKGVERCIRRAEGVALVVGPPGTGKSLLLLKLAEQVRDDFDVALLTGASICTRRALWQSILAAIGEPYRGIDEADLRIGVVERIRGLAAAGSGLVILVDEAHTLPTRLIEELRLLTNVPTPLPAVHIVLAGGLRLEELLGTPRMASLAQRIAVRGYLEPLDHAETLAYLQTQVTAAGLEWERLFAAGCDDAVYRVTEGVPRLINQVCDQALVLVAESDRLVTPADIAAAWGEIQRLPVPAGLEPGRRAGESTARTAAGFDAAGCTGLGGELAGDDLEVIEFGAGDDRGCGAGRRQPAAGELADPWGGPDVELVFDAGGDPFEEFFADEEQVVERYLMSGPDDFRDRRTVTSQEGQALGRVLATIGREPGPRPAEERKEPVADGAGPAAAGKQDGGEESAGIAVAEADEIDDADMVVIEEDLHDAAGGASAAVFSVRPSDYRSLFTRLRRGDRRG